MTVKWLPKAIEGLANAIRFTKREFGNTAALKLASTITHNNKILARNPRIGCIEYSICTENTEYRYLIAHPYKEIYHIENGTVYIDLLWHTYRNPEAIQDEIGINIICENPASYIPNQSTT